MRRNEKVEIKMEIEIKVYDPKTGKVTLERKVPCHTFLKNFSALAHLIIPRGDAIISDTVTDISGNARTATGCGSSAPVPFTYVSESPSYKIFSRIGTNTTAFSRNQYDVLTYLAEIAYGNFTLTDTGSQKELRITYAWTNGTGLAKDVSECVLGIWVYVAGMYKVAISRDVFSPAINVPNGQVLALGYVITVPW